MSCKKQSAAISKVLAVVDNGISDNNFFIKIYKIALKFVDLMNDEQDVEAFIKLKIKDLGYKIITNGTVSSNGKIKIYKQINNIFDKLEYEHFKAHEEIHKKTYDKAIKKFGKNTDKFSKHWSNPTNWILDELKAYRAGCKFYRDFVKIIKEHYKIKKQKGTNR